MGAGLGAMTTRQATAGKTPAWTSQIRRLARTAGERGQLGCGRGISDGRGDKRRRGGAAIGSGEEASEMAGSEARATVELRSEVARGQRRGGVLVQRERCERRD